MYKINKSSIFLIKQEDENLDCTPFSMVPQDH